MAAVDWSRRLLLGGDHGYPAAAYALVASLLAVVGFLLWYFLGRSY